MCFILHSVCSMWGGGREHVTSVWVHQHVNVLCLPQMCWRELGRRRPGFDPCHPREHPVAQSDPLGSTVILVEGSAHTSPLEVVVEESVDLHQGDCIYYEEDSTIPGPSATSLPIRSTPSRSTPSRGTPSRSSPSRSTLSGRAQASPSPRKALRKTRGVPRALQEGLHEEQAWQTRHIGAMVGDLRRVVDSLASSAQSQAACTAALQQSLTLQADQSSNISDSLQDVSRNCVAMVTCMGEQQAATAVLTAEVRRLAVAVEANTAAVEAEGRQTRRHQHHNTTRQLRMLA